MAFGFLDAALLPAVEAPSWRWYMTVVCASATMIVTGMAVERSRR